MNTHISSALQLSRACGYAALKPRTTVEQARWWPEGFYAECTLPVTQNYRLTGPRSNYYSSRSSGTYRKE